MDLAQNLSTAKCALDFQPCAGSQCGKCGALARPGFDNEKRCDVCGTGPAENITLSRPRASTGVDQGGSRTLNMSL